MTLLAPWALWFAVLGGAVVALYLLKIKRRRATVPALDFWLDLAGRTKVHSLFERLKRLLSMLLWIAVVACLMLALGNPILSLGRIKPRAIVVIVDNSASMQAAEDDRGRTRLAMAREAVSEITSRRPVADQWLLIEAAREPRVLHPWTYETRPIRKAAESLTPYGGTGNLAAAVELAGQLAAGKPDPCIVVVSDGQAGAIERLATADARVVYWPVGKATDNLGISRLAVRTDRLHGNYLGLIGITNSSDQKVDTQVTLEVNGTTHSVELVNVEPGAAWEKTITIEPPGEGATNGGVLRAVIDRPDALALDNQAFAILQPIRPAVVWLVSNHDSSFFFEQALASMTPLIVPEESMTMTLERYEQVAAAIASQTAAIAKPPDLIIFDNCAPAALPPVGRFVLINALPAKFPARVVGTLETPQMYLAPSPHSITQHISLTGSRLARASLTRFDEPVRTLAGTAEGDPLIVLIEQPNRQMVYLAFDVLDSDLPFRNAFPLLLRNIVAFMHEEAPASSAWLKPAYQIGEVVRPLRPLPESMDTATVTVLRSGKMEDRALRVSSRTFSFDDTGVPGAIRFGAGEERSYASINLADAGESRIAPAPAVADAALQLHLSRGILGSMPWVGLALLALAAIGLEWMTYHFRWTE